MISCEYMGRLGNNMFQIAVTKALALKFNEVALFPYHPDLNWLPIRIDRPENIYVAPEHVNGFTDIPHKPNMTIVGFFQRHEYFDHIKADLIELFQVPKDWQPNTVCIHVRRGDFLYDQINFPCITIEYIKQALQLVNQKKVVFCSDDLTWCKENFSYLDNVSFRENTSAIQDIYFGANCDSVIMSNSTFSFWMGYLSLRDRKIVFPLNWFAKNSGRNGYEICPKEWIGI